MFGELRERHDEDECTTPTKRPELSHGYHMYRATKRVFEAGEVLLDYKPNLQVYWLVLGPTANQARNARKTVMLQLLSTHYPWIEWGVLFRPDLEGTAR